MEITIVEDQIISTPVQAPSWALEELLACIHKKNTHPEIETGAAAGNETWKQTTLDI